MYVAYIHDWRLFMNRKLFIPMAACAICAVGAAVVIGAMGQNPVFNDGNGGHVLETRAAETIGNWFTRKAGEEDIKKNGEKVEDYTFTNQFYNEYGRNIEVKSPEGKKERKSDWFLQLVGADIPVEAEATYTVTFNFFLSYNAKYGFSGETEGFSGGRIVLASHEGSDYDLTFKQVWDLNKAPSNYELSSTVVTKEGCDKIELQLNLGEAWGEYAFTLKSFTIEKAGGGTRANQYHAIDWMNDWDAFRTAHKDFCSLSDEEKVAVKALVARYDALNVETINVIKDKEERVADSNGAKFKYGESVEFARAL